MSAPDGFEFKDGVAESVLTVVMDVRLPAAYLALGPTIAFGRERGLTLNWLPSRVAPLNPPSRPSPDDDRSILHRRHRAEMIAREIATYAEAQGLLLRDYYRNGDASALELAWLYVRGTQEPRVLEDLLEAMFAAYWSVELDPADRVAVAGLVDGVCAQGAAFEAWAAEAGAGVAMQVSDALAEHGLGGAPGYLVDGEFFQGRQHLEMIGWILDGRSGPGPI